MIRPMPDALRAVFATIPGDIVIAGGAAVNYEKAGDIDVFFFNREEWQATLDIFGAEAVPCPYNECLLGQVIVTLDRLYGDATNRLVQLIYHPNVRDVGELLAGFDTSTHAQAYSRDGTLHLGPKWTPEDVPPTITRTSTPFTTRQRYLRIVERYGFEPDPNELAKVPVGERVVAA